MLNSNVADDHLDTKIRMETSEVRMALDRLLLDGAATSSSRSSSSSSAASIINARAAADDETDSSSSSSSSLSSHSSTLKGCTTIFGGREQQQQQKYYNRPDRLNQNNSKNSANLPLGDKGPAPPSPRSTKPPLEGISAEETLRKMSVGNKELAVECQTRTITSRTPKDFFFIKVLGEGSFSTVYFAKEVDTNDEYAIKVSMKSEIRKEGRVRYVLREKDIMAALTYAYGGHPFVISLYCTFQDNDRLYFALTYAKHGELLDWLRKLGSFDEDATLFYASEILCALEFLHRCKIIHRDLKPENILVGADWHIMVSDFGTAKILDQQPGGTEPPPIEPLPPGEMPARRNVQLDDAVKAPTTNNNNNNNVRSSFVGTAHYISPEVLKSEDVGPECDYWALGAIIFQMISGQPPFRAVNDYKILKKILQLDYRFPDGFPEVAKDLVSRLLVYKPTKRLGSQKNGGIDGLKGHPFFKSVDWDNIFTRKPPELKPYLPASCGEPAFYGDYKPPTIVENIEPGLNEAALSRLMGLDSRGGGGFSAFKFGGGGNYEESSHHCSSSSASSSFSSTPTSSSSFGELLPYNRFPSAFPSSLQIPTPEELERQRQCRLEHQRREHKYHRFVQENVILKFGLIDKKKGLFARRRMFLLTEGPHLFYVDPVSMHLKGEVPFSAQMRTEAKNFRTFFVHTPKRTYYLFDPERHAKDWCDAIDWARKKYFGGQTIENEDAEKDGGNGEKQLQKMAKIPAGAATEEIRSRPGSAAGRGNGGGNGKSGGIGLLRRAKAAAAGNSNNKGAAIKS